MKSLFETLKDYKVERRKTNPRSDLIKSFQQQLNREGFDIPWIGVNMKLIHIKDYDHLKDFYKKCLEYKSKKGSFSRCFFGALKIKKK
jgi:hypothetical protein